MAEAVNAQAYNSLWQFRMDGWSSLEEASDRLGVAAGSGRPLDKLAERVATLLDELEVIERYWAYPGPQAYQQGRRLFAAGKYTRFARAVGSLNRGLVTGSYRSGAAWSVATAIQEPFERDTGLPAETQGARPYFEVLLVEDMPDAQERALREELRKWRRPDDEFVYELVIVHSFEDALIAARLNFNIQACVIRRRFAHRSGRDLSALNQFLGEGAPEDLMEQSPDTRAKMLGQALAAIRPELDLYLMTEISLEDVAGWMGHHFRRIFHPREGTLELGLPPVGGHQLA
jgi:arginine decarboxylase